MGAKKKSGPSRNDIHRANGSRTLAQPPQAFLVRIPERTDRERAIVAFLHVPRTYCRFKDYRFLVTSEHIEALAQAGIPFTDVTEPV
jgi:hypothetical protein